MKTLKTPNHALEQERAEKAEKAFFRKVDLCLGLVSITTLIAFVIFMFYMIKDTIC